MKKKYLVTGGTGFLGRSIVSSLLHEGHDVTIFDNDSRGSFEKLGKEKNEVQFINGDIREYDVVKKATRKIDSIIHLAYVNGTENFYKKPELVLEVAVKGMTHIMDAAKENGVKELFLASSSEVYNEPPLIPTPETVPLVIPDPFNPRYTYSGGKILCELMAIHYSHSFERTVIFRPHNVYGPAMGFEHVIPQFIMRAKEMKEKKQKTFSIQGNGKQSRSFIYIDDFTAGLMLLLKKGENVNIYNIGIQSEITIISLAEQIISLMGERLKIVPGELTKGSPSRRCPDMTKLTSLGFTRSTTLAEGLKKTIEWYTKANV